MKILIIKTTSMGDLVHCLPAVNNIATYFPDAEIHWLAETSFVDIARLHPRVTQVHNCHTRTWRKKLFSRKTWQEIQSLRQQIQQEKYDYIIDFQGLIKSALWIFNSGTQLSHGYDKHSIKEPFATLLYSNKHSVSKNMHAVERNQKLAAAALRYDLGSTVDFGLSNTYERNKSVVFLHGTSRANKSLSIDIWQDLARQMNAQGYKIILPRHSNHEYQQAQTIASVAPNSLILDKMSLAQLVPYLAQASLVIAVDTGLAHLANALTTPTLALFVASNPKLTGVIGEAATNLLLTDNRTLAKIKPVNQGNIQPHIIQAHKRDMSTIYKAAQTLIDKALCTKTPTKPDKLR